MFFGMIEQPVLKFTTNFLNMPGNVLSYKILTARFVRFMAGEVPFRVTSWLCDYPLTGDLITNQMTDCQQYDNNNTEVKQGISHSHQCIDRFKADHHQSSGKDDQDEWFIGFHKYYFMYLHCSENQSRNGGHNNHQNYINNSFLCTHNLSDHQHIGQGK